MKYICLTLFPPGSHHRPFKRRETEHVGSGLGFVPRFVESLYITCTLKTFAITTCDTWKLFSPLIHTLKIQIRWKILSIFIFPVHLASARTDILRNKFLRQRAKDPGGDQFPHYSWMSSVTGQENQRLQLPKPPHLLLFSSSVWQNEPRDHWTLLSSGPRTNT